MKGEMGAGSPQMSIFVTNSVGIYNLGVTLLCRGRGGGDQLLCRRWLGWQYRKRQK